MKLNFNNSFFLEQRLNPFLQPGTSTNTGGGDKSLLSPNTGGGDKSLLSPNTALVKSPYANSNSSRSSMNSTRSRSSPNPFTSSVQLTSHIDKLFSDRIEVYSIVEM